MSPAKSGGSLDDRIRSFESSAVRRMSPHRTRFVEKIAPSGLWVPPRYGNALGSDLRRAARPIGTAALSLSLAALASCGEVNQPPGPGPGPDPDPDPDPICEVNPIEQVALDADVPYEWVRALGEDCEVDADEQWFVSDFLPELRSRTTDRIAETYRKFILDDGEFEADERLVLSRYFEGRINHEGVKINPGYFELYDANINNPETRLAVANAEWVPLFVTPFANRVIPGYQNNGYGEPYYEDGSMDSANLIQLPNRDEGQTFLDLLSSALQPQPDSTVSYPPTSTQIIFAQDQTLVNHLPGPAQVIEISYLENYGNDGSMVRNARVFLSQSDRSPSLGFSDLEAYIIHADADRLIVQEGDILQPEQVFGYSELNLGGGIQVIWGFYTSDGHVGDGDRFTKLDVFDPSFTAPQSRGLIPQVALYQSVDENGEPIKIFYGNLQSSAVKDGRGMAVDGTWDPLVYTKP